MLTLAVGSTASGVVAIALVVSWHDGKLIILEERNVVTKDFIGVL